MRTHSQIPCKPSEGASDLHIPHHERSDGAIQLANGLALGLRLSPSFAAFVEQSRPLIRGEICVSQECSLSGTCELADVVVKLSDEI